MRTFSVVTTCHAAGYAEYGRRMIETFDRHWPDDIPLILYRENFVPEVRSDRIVVRDLVRSCPDLMAFKRRHADNPLAHGRDPALPLPAVAQSLQEPDQAGRAELGRRLPLGRGALRPQGLRHLPCRQDLRQRRADLGRRRQPVLRRRRRGQELESFVPPDRFVGCLQRPTYTECGFIAYNLRHPATQQMLAAFERLYTEDGLFREYEFHDAYLFDVVRRQIEQAGHRSYDIAEGIGARAKHVLINSRLGRFMDHVKGGRKDAGHSGRGDPVVDRRESYWANSA